MRLVSRSQIFPRYDPLGLQESTSASKFRSELLATGRAQEEISPLDLLPFHQELREKRKKQGIGNMTDFSGIDQLLPEPLPSLEISTCQVTGLIVETRCHPNLKFVVEQVCQRLSIPVQVVHGSENSSFVQDVLRDKIDSDRVFLLPLRSGEMNEFRYNALLMSQRFWNMMIGRQKILVFQTDAVLCSKSRYSLQDFMHLDYVGSAWGRREQRGGLSCDGGNGGLSLRDWGRSVECLERFPPEIWPSAEDKFFPFHMELIGANVASPSESVRFGAQHWFVERSFGAHKISFMDPVQLGQFLDYCPDAERIAGNKRPDRSRYRRGKANLKRFLIRRSLKKMG